MSFGRAPSGAPENSGPEVAPSGVRVSKRSVVVSGHRTSVSLEDAFWRALKSIAAHDGVSLAALVARVDGARGEANLSSALRVFALERASGAQGVNSAGARQDERRLSEI